MNRAERPDAALKPKRQFRRGAPVGAGSTMQALCPRPPPGAACRSQTVWRCRAVTVTPFGREP
jgi:hypothetical protein